MPESKRENSVLTWTFHPSKDHDGQTLTCRADNPATTDSMLATVTMEVKCEFSSKNREIQFSPGVDSMSSDSTTMCASLCSRDSSMGKCTGVVVSRNFA